MRRWLASVLVLLVLVPACGKKKAESVASKALRVGLVR